MTETRWKQIVEQLRKGRTAFLDDGCKIVPFGQRKRNGVFTAERLQLYRLYS